MAKLKLEWLGHYWQANRMPVRDQLFAHLPRLSRRFSGPAAGMVNAVAESGAVRAMLERTLGIDGSRALPSFAREPFTRWFAGYLPKTQAEPSVILFQDTFNTYHKTEAAKAAVRFFDAIGLRVELGRHRCCGRTYMSKGLVEHARAAARHTVDALYPQVMRGLPIVGLEPSCVLSLRDEYLSLLPGDEKARKVADAAMTFEEFVAGLRLDTPHDGVRWSLSAGKVLVHGHCHQKALAGMDTTERALSLPGCDVEVIDSACCGMAGAFGYEKEHVHWSIAMAERSLAPAVRMADPETPIIASGFSCRSQIEQTTGRKVLHPAEWLASCIIQD